MAIPTIEQLTGFITKFRTNLTNVQKSQVASTALTIFNAASPPVSGVVAVRMAIEQLGF